MNRFLRTCDEKMIREQMKQPGKAYKRHLLPETKKEGNLGRISSLNFSVPYFPEDLPLRRNYWTLAPTS